MSDYPESTPNLCTFKINTDMYRALDASAREGTGLPLFDLADERPAEAFKLLINHFHHVVGHPDTTKILAGDEEDSPSISSDMDGIAAARSIAKRRLSEQASDAALEPATVVINVFRNRRIWDRILPSRVTSARPKSIKVFTVTPTNLL